jgi:hypothetical protein
VIGDPFETNLRQPVLATVEGQAQGPPPGPTCVPSDPGLSGSNPGTSAVNLNLTNTGPCSKARLYRALGVGGFEFLKDLGGATTYTDYTTVAGQTYRYVATTYNGENSESAYSAVVTVTPTDSTPPPVPAITSVTVSGNSATLGMEGQCPRDVLGLNLYISQVSGGPYTKVNSAPIKPYSPSGEWTQAGLQSGVTYYFVATAVDIPGNESAYSNQVAVTGGP